MIEQPDVCKGRAAGDRLRLVHWGINTMLAAVVCGTIGFVATAVPFHHGNGFWVGAIAGMLVYQLGHRVDDAA